MALPTQKRVTGLDLARMMILLWGVRGVGKSTLAASEAPEKTIFASTHDGLGSISCYEVKITSLKVLWDMFKDLKTDGGERFTNLVVDDIDDVYEMVFASTLKKSGFDSIMQVPSDDTPSVYSAASASFNRFFQELRELPQSIRLISGQRVNEPRKARKSIDPVVVSCGLSNSARRIVAKHCDGMWRLSYEEGTGRRMIRFVPFEKGLHQIECKSRLPDSAAGTLPLAEVPITDGGGKCLPWPDAITARFKQAMEGTPA